MKVRFFLFLVLCLGVSGCAEEHMEMVFFGGGEAGEAGVGSTITGVPEELQVLLWGDRDVFMQYLLALPEHADGLVPVWDNWGAGREIFMEFEKAQEYLLDQICMIDRQREYYTKYIDAGGVAIIGHYRVDDAHFYNARDVILIMTSKRPELRERLTPYYGIAPAGSTTNIRYPSKFRMVLFQSDPGFPTMPEFPNGHGNAGSCGSWCVAMVTPPIHFNIWSDYSVVVHEFAHAMHYAINDFHIAGNPIPDGINKLDTTFQARLEAAYAVALANAVEWPAPFDKYFKSEYAMTNDREYWAEGVRYWFQYVALEYEGKQLYHDSFLKKDPLLYALLDEWFPLVSVAVKQSVD